MPFKKLFHIVFTDSGGVKNCGRDACSALIERLDTEFVSVFGTTYPGSFGDRERGFLKLPDAFTTGLKICEYEDCENG